jgi:hypothetical protein
MKKFLKFSLAVAVAVVFFTGCTSNAIKNIEASQFTVENQSNVTLNSVAKEIIGAGSGLGWQMKKVKDGEIIGTIYLRKHMAQVRITYTTKDYSIVYKSSSNLNYDSTKNTIHRNYNGWIQNLDNAIKTRLGML